MPPSRPLSLLSLFSLPFPRSHAVYRRWKIILNIYDIFPSGWNRLLTGLGLGGVFHSAIQYRGREYFFGAHYEDNKASREQSSFYSVVSTV